MENRFQKNWRAGFLSFLTDFFLPQTTQEGGNFLKEFPPL
jgi:hypothetical protein